MPETEARIPEALRLGAVHVLAAAASGISYEMMREWVNTKPASSVAVLDAENYTAPKFMSPSYAKSKC